jgi:hypothetical protein
MSKTSMTLTWSVGETIYQSTELQPDHLDVRGTLYSRDDIDRLRAALGQMREMFPEVAQRAASETSVSSKPE